MSDGTLLMILLVPAVLAFAFGVWAGLGYPGLYDKYERTGRAPRESPLSWLLRGGRRPLRSDLEARQTEKEEAADGEEEEDGSDRDRASRPSFARGRRFGR